ncbi:MAG: glycosyltransferase [Parcubacteria group bacterium]|nr:glycosyltransferase [Parcubacteria group bacterium]
MDNSEVLTDYLNNSVHPKPYVERLRSYYYRDLQHIIHHIVPKEASVVHFGSRLGNLLGSLPNRVTIGVEASEKLVSTARKKYKRIHFIYAPLYKNTVKQQFNVILITHLFSYISDVQKFVADLRRLCFDKSRVTVVSFNFFWKPVLDLASFLGLRVKLPFEPNWLSDYDIENLFHLEGFELIKKEKRMLLPLYMPGISELVNRYISHLPIFNSLCLTTIQIFRKMPTEKNFSVSILIPARNEEGNIAGLLDRIPSMGTTTEVIFIEGHSRDNTYTAIQKELVRYTGPINASLYKQKGIGKKDAIELGFRLAKNDLVMILDADLTVAPGELSKFYWALAKGQGELIIGTRLVYPIEKQAMRTLNYFGNKFFSAAFTFLLGQMIKDTLCGTKALLKSTYLDIIRVKKMWGGIDPYGDFDLIFGAAKLNLKILEIPVRYRERTYGTTNITRFQHGLLLLRMTFHAAKKLKFI